MPNIFVSYSHDDREQAELIIKLLQRFDEDYDIWWDFQIRSGTNWRTTIENEIRNRDIFIFLMSPDSMASDYCHVELQIARDSKRFLLPVIIEQPIDDSKMPEDVAEFLHDFQYVDLSGKGDKSFELTKLFNALKWFEESVADTSIRSASALAEMAKAMNAGIPDGINLLDFNSAQTLRGQATRDPSASDPLRHSQPITPRREAQRLILLAILVSFVAVIFFGIIFLFVLFNNLTPSAQATAAFATAVEERIMTRNANATSIAASAVTDTSTPSLTPTTDSTATAEILALMAQQSTDMAVTTFAQGTREASTAIALLETQSAQLTADAPTNTPLPTDTPLPTATATLTPSDTATITPNASETAAFELAGSSTAVAQQTAIIIEQTSVHQTAVAEQQALATQAPTEMFPEGRLIKLYYNDGSFYTQNTASLRIRLSRLAFQALASGGEEFASERFESTSFIAVSNYSFVDGDGRCVGIEFFTSETSPLEPEACEPASNYNALLNMSINTSSIFWRPKEDIAQFAVFWDEQEIARCPTNTGYCEVRVGN
jgi:hypothetical protein